jgi:hypothetical protein
MSVFLLDQVNPLRRLGQRELTNLLEASQLGYLARLQWLYYFIEKRDPMVRATKRRLLSALQQLDWDIKISDVGDDEQKKTMAEKQAEDLRAAYDKVVNLREALNFLCLADLRGYAHLEKIYRGETTQIAAPPTGPEDGTVEAIGLDETSETAEADVSSRNGPAPETGATTTEDPWDITELRIVDQWFWTRYGRYGTWKYNPQAQETNNGTAVDLTKFIIREVEDPADEIFAELAVKRKVNDQDWDGFLEDFGVPPTFIIGPPGIPLDKEAQYQKVAEQIVARSKGYLPNGSDVKTPSAGGSGGAGIFRERLDYIDEQIVIAGTSGKLTVLTQSGAGTLAGGAQKEAFDQIADAIATGVASVMQKQFDKALLDRLHPGEPVLAYFAFSRVQPDDSTKVLTDASTAAQAGFAIDAQELSEKSGYKLTYVGRPGPATPGADGALAGANGNKPAVEAAVPSRNGPAPTPTPQPTPAPAQPQPAAGDTATPGPVSDPEKLNTLLRTASAQLAEAESADLTPLRRAIETAITDPTPEKLQVLLDQLPELQQQLGTTSAEVLRRTMSAALANGLTS